MFLVVIMGFLKKSITNQFEIDGIEELKKQLNIPIIATLGKNGWQKIDDFYASGARIFRINGSHIADEEELKNVLQNVNDILQKYNDASLMYDTQGAEIRLLIKDDENKGYYDACYQLQKGDILAIHTNLADKEICFSYNSSQNTKNSENGTFHLGVNYDKFINDVKVGNNVVIDGGLVNAIVSSIDYDKSIVYLKITQINLRDNNYTLKDRRHVNLCGLNVSQPTLTDADRKYIQMSVLNNVKYLAISFVRSREDIIMVKNLIRDTFLQAGLNNEDAERRANEIKVIAKFETKQGMKNVNEIMQIADGSMIARGDLANEILPEKVPYAKQQIISATRCHKDKICILATDVLKNLSYEYIPSRNDIDVITTSLMMGVNSLMLSDETATSNFGNQAIEIFDKCIKLFKKKTIKSYYKWYFTNLQECVYFKPLKSNDKNVNNGFYKFYIKYRKKTQTMLYLMAIFGADCLTNKDIFGTMFMLKGNKLWLNPKNIVNFIDLSCGKAKNRIFENKSIDFANKWFNLVNENEYNLYSLLKRFLKPNSELLEIDKYSKLFS